MAQKVVLSVGQCRPDQAALTHFLKSHFDAEVPTADLPADVDNIVSARDVDLILINRKLDADYSDGLDILRNLKADSASTDLVLRALEDMAPVKRRVSK